jgi:hypothetical protein
VDPLATPDDAVGYGYTLPPDTAEQDLARASARIRRAARESITPATVTLQVDVEHGQVRLPAPPVIEVTAVSVVAADGTTTPVAGWWWDGERIRLDGISRGRVEVTYSRGWAPVPDGVVELACAVASRLGNTPKGMETGVRERQVEDYREVYAAEAVQSAAALLPGEEAALRAALFVPAVGMVKSG